MPQPTPMIQIGKFRIDGRWAQLILLAILALVVVQIMRHPPTFQKWPLWISAVEWLCFIGYWSNAAKNSAPARKSESKKSRAVHELLLNIALLLLFVPIPGLRMRFVPASNTAAGAGLAIQAAAIAFAIWARRHLGKHWSGEITIKVDHQLIRSGPYRLIRHPIYTGWLGCFVGSAIASGEVHALISVALAIFAYGRKIRMEESNLDEAFGGEYAEYKRRTWALIPLLF